MKKKVDLSKALIVIVVTNLITVLIFTIMFIPYIGKKNMVTDDEYEFVKKYSKLMNISKIVKENYVDKIDENKMVEGAIKGMVTYPTDRYTVYMNQKEFQDLMSQTEGAYAGVGIYLDEKDGRIVVVAPIEDSPAAKAGVKSQDVIVKVNNQDVFYKDIDKAMSMMKGKEGMKVKLTVYREGTGYVDFNLKTEKIIIKSVKNKMLDGGIGYIRITTFDEYTADEFNKALTSLQGQGMKGLVIDLRDNGGGLLESSTEIADKLLGAGTIVYTIDNKGERNDWKSDANKINVPLALLVNEGTASASEILSGSVRDFKAGTLIGTKTFGKGIVQTIMPLQDNSGIKVTTSRYYTPSGECIQGTGIKPDIVIEGPQDVLSSELKFEDDVQLKKAIEVINSQK